MLSLKWLAKLASGIVCLAVTAGYIRRTWQADSAARRDMAFGLGIVAMLLVSPITWDHYFLLLALPLAILWAQRPASTPSQAFLLTMIVVLGIVNPKWIWDATIVGDGELVFLPDQIASVAQPWQTLTLISYQFYALFALFVFCCYTAAPGGCKNEPQPAPVID